MLLYHVSVILQHDGLFTPCVPDCVFDGDDEEDETPRICFSDSIEGCLTSIPDGGRGLREYITFNGSRFKVFILDTDKYNVNILTPEEIKDMVPDALITREHWVLDEVTINDYIIIDVKDFEFNEETKRIENLKYNIVTSNPF